MRSRWFKFLPVLVICGLLLGACNAGIGGNSQVTYQISPTFREVYEKLGGEEVLGPAISDTLSFDPYQCQYTVNAMFCVNPQSTDAGRLFLYPLGAAMAVKEDPSQSPAESGSTVIDGYTLYDEFLSLYNQLGAQFTGRPLTQAHINYSQQRVEQYFENVGFYRKFSDPAGEVHLLAYGAYSCMDECSYTPLVEASILNATRAGQNQPLLGGLSAIADTAILGKPLTQPYIAADAMEEQVYENAVVYAPVNDLEAARLRPISTLLNIPQTDPGPQKYTSSDGMVFYAVKGGKGYHVPLVFDQFIAAHGGMDYSGNPIDEVFQYTGNVYRQCFENYCLDYDASASEADQVSLAPLGIQYLQQISGSSAPTLESSDLSAGNLALSVAEQSNQVAAEDQQKIDILVTQRSNQQPVSNVTAALIIALPDGSQYTASFPATGLDGRASLLVPAMKEVSNGTILEYQVCLDGTDGNPVCATGSYLIWPEE
jgi:hypothetical protein